jgi:lipoate-protein ligase A
VTEEWRLLRTGFSNAFANMAIDEAVLISRIEGSVQNTIRFYRWNPSAISLGFSQQVENEVQVDVCKELGIDLVRRPTGGGAVYHDSAGELTYSIVVNLDAIPSDLISSYKQLCQGIILACEELGLKAQLSFDETGRQCPNITIDGKKISGGAQTRRRNALLQHGTVLLDSDLETMTKILKMGQSSPCMPLERLESKVTTVRRALGKSVSFERMEDCMRLGFERALNMKLREQDLTSTELRFSSELQLKKYQTRDWNFKR